MNPNGRGERASTCPQTPVTKPKGALETLTFDWLFSYPIAGLVTAYGGANSHMAIRAGELGLPAVIGSGELLYRRWSAAEVLSMDCANRLVSVVR